MKPVSFSVIVTCYNYRDFVREAVESALAQTRAPSQVIVVDDGSTDGSSELLRDAYGDDPRVTLVSGKNGGQLVAFQRGLHEAHGDVIVFLDADDRWKPDYLARIGELYDQRQDVHFVFTDVQLFGEDERLLQYADRPLDLGMTVISTYFTRHWYGAPTSALSLRTQWASLCLDLPESFQRLWRISADNCLVFGASMFGARKYYLPTGSVEYRIHGNNGWWSKRTETGDYLNAIRSLGLIHHYARMSGLDEACVELTKREFKTKPEASMREARRYARIVMRRKRAPWKNPGRALAIMARVWRNRDHAPVEYPTH